MSTVTAPANGAAPLSDLSPDPKVDPDAVFGSVMALVPDIQKSLEQIDGRRQALQEEFRAKREELAQKYQGKLAELGNETKRLSGLLRALGQNVPEPSKLGPGRSSGVKSAAKGVKGVRPEILSALVDAILAQGNDAFTALTIHERAGAHWVQQTTYSAFKYLRAVEFIRRAAGKADGNRQLWRILDREVGERLKGERLKGGEAPSPSQPVKKATSGSEPPTPGQIKRTVEAIQAFSKPTFTTLEINEALGLKSPKATYAVFRLLREKEIVTEAGSRTDERGQHAQTIFQLEQDRLKELTDAL